MTGIALGRSLASHSFRIYRTHAPRVLFSSSPNFTKPAVNGSTNSFQYALPNKGGLNRKVLKTAKAYGIGFPKELRRIKYKFPPGMPNLGAFALSISRKHLFDARSQEYFEEHEHPFAQSILDKYIEHCETRPLWFYIHAQANTPKNCVWKEAEKRLRRATVHVLADRGYDYNGRRKLAGGETHDSDGKPLPAQLLGTIRIFCGEPTVVCNIKPSKIRAQIGFLIDRVELMLAADNRGQHMHPYPHLSPEDADTETKF